ncbi:glycosyltransferase, partial [Lacticaseibacillus paracasei subsp. paracasei Lpp71]
MNKSDNFTTISSLNLFDEALEADRVVVATELQRQDLLIDFPSGQKKFATIPVGGVADKATQ